MDQPKSKSEAKRVAVMGHASPSVEAKPTHRYFCDACTGTAFTVNIHNDMPETVTCKVCGKVQPFKRENLIKM